MTSTTRTHHLPLNAVSGAAAAALLVAVLAGCSSSGSKASSDITGAQSAPPTTASASPSPTAAQPAGAPPIALPDDVIVNLEFKPSGDATKDKVSADLSYALKAFNEAQAKGDINLPSMLYSYTGTAGAYMKQAVDQLTSRNQTITGTDRYYALTVDVKDTSHAVVAYCESQAASYAKDKASGKVLTTTPGINDFTDWTMSMELSDKGVWRVATPLAEKGSTRCQSAA
ncbi:hypothetical protein GCM10010441_39190 [Kitasatospora paracochleata]|uniref:Outer membrane murein-binding lipoprotein Lpp n=1 Tax=Kitasatospora paracochleata TaxID=58354 RepID=A0ABT1JA28_9ACTN|nr:hypothetical protein [Kitasatospora paracochleata]MCP2313964.1 outer membrane murein-binding lipoprotein Lpp [Kitasatospora paracochleata]